MLPCFTLKIVTDFAAAHTLRNYQGACSRMHGHNWKLEVDVSSQELDEAGMVLDFKKIKQAAKTLVDKLDHQYLNEIEPFDKINPTAENIARFFYQGLTKILDDSRVRIAAVTIWETERACARYSEEN